MAAGASWFGPWMLYANNFEFCIASLKIFRSFSLILNKDTTYINSYNASFSCSQNHHFQ